MNTNDYVAEIIRATSSLKAGDQVGVNAIVRNALAIAGLPGAGGSDVASPSSDLPHGKDKPITGSHDRLHKPLGDVLRTLKAAGSKLNFGDLGGLDKRGKTPEVPVPDGARFVEERFSCSMGTRRYRLYVPSTAEDGMLGMIVMLHGCTQTPEDFAVGTGMNAIAEEHRLLIVYPAQTNGDNAMACWNWFRPEDQKRGAGEPAIIAALTQALRDEYAIPGDKVFIAGLSAGGAMAAVMAETYPELYAAIGVHSGLAYGAANDAMSAFSAMRGQGALSSHTPGAGLEAGPRVIVFHGTADGTVHPSNAEMIVERKGARRGKVLRHDAAEGIRGYTRLATKREDGTHGLECWIIDGAQHAWSGGHASGSYTDPQGPDASRAMVHFFMHGSTDVL